MKDKEKIKVLVKIRKGKTVCICLRGRKCRTSECCYDVVERDRFRGWESTAVRNRYGK